jgi:GNAT superfamily N-acetyltransferase
VCARVAYSSSPDLLILVVDPAFQRRGLGKLLLQDGLERAHRAGFPVFLSASPKGVPLYKSLGFEVKSAPELTKAKILATMMVKEKS